MGEAEEAKKRPRRKRFVPSGAPAHGMTRIKLRLLAYIAECYLLKTSQVAHIADMTVHAVRPHLNDLHEMNLVGRIAVPHANLAPPGEHGPNLAYGPGETIHVATRAGLEYLRQAGLIDEELATRKPPQVGPKNAMFVAHELLVRDVRVWLETCSRINGGYVERWVDGTAAHLPPARPDAWFLYRLANGRTLLGLVEADRGTERGNQWAWKTRDYIQLLAGETLAEATGGRRKARLVIVTQDSARRDHIAHLLSESAMIAPITFAANLEDLQSKDEAKRGLSAPIWNNPLVERYLTPLVPKDAE